MFTSIRLKNYRTFSDITVDLTEKNGAPKRLIMFYGENGVGKSNFTSAFLTFAETMRTMHVRDFLQELIASNKVFAENERIINLLRSQLRELETIIQDIRTIGSDGNVEIELNFVVQNKKGRYLMEFGDKEIVHERLEFVLDKNKGVYFDITPKAKKLNEKVFIDRVFLSDLKLNIQRFWGKHTLLSILQHEREDKSEEYLRKSISEYFKTILDDFMKLSCTVKCPNRPERGVVGLVHPLLKSLIKGDVNNEKVSELLRVESLLKEFLPKINCDIIEVYYKTEKAEKRTSYELYTVQMISGGAREIPFALESTGTQAVLELLPFFLNAADGATVVIDELDTGIHDQRVCDLLTSIYPEINGQMIITTHNTMLMETDLPANSFYTMFRDKHGNRSINCITEIGARVHPNHNIRERYNHGVYFGTPAPFDMSLKEMLKLLQEKS